MHFQEVIANFQRRIMNEQFMKGFGVEATGPDIKFKIRGKHIPKLFQREVHRNLRPKKTRQLEGS